MEEIKLYIITDEDQEKDSVNYLNSNSNNKHTIDIETIKEEYKEWIRSLIIFMNSCNYRKVIGDIEKRKHKFKLLDIFDLWKYKILKAQAIFKIIKIKFKKYKQEIQKENLNKISTIEFWFNQIYFLLEELLSDFIPDDTNKNNIDLDSKQIIEPVQYIIEIFFEFIFLLVKFHYLRNGGAMEIGAYISIINNFIPFLSFIYNFKSIYFLQIFTMLKAKIFFENQSYLQSIEQQNKVFDLCFRAFKLISDLDKKINNLSTKVSFTREIYNNFINYLLAFYLRGVTFEHLGDMQRATQAYTSSRIIYMKYLVEDNEKFGMFLSKIDTEARLNLDICNDVRIIIRKKKELQRKKAMRKKLKSNYYRIRSGYKDSRFEEKKEKNGNDKYIHHQDSSLINNNLYNRKKYKPNIINRGIKDKFRVAQLEKYLNHIGENLYIEEENINNNIINKFTKTKYILSTITMIDNLLSEDFQNILLKMDNIEITKPKDEIKSMIDKTILAKRGKLFNLNLEKKNRQKSAINAYRTKRNYCHNKNFKTLKDSQNMFRDDIKISTKMHETISTISNNYQKLGFSTTKREDFNEQKNKQKNQLSISQRMPDANSFKIKVLQDNNSQKNISIKKINYRLKSAIDRGNDRKKYKYNYSQVEKYHFDKKYLSKSHIRKKIYLDKYLDKEFIFQKQLLNSKRNEVKDISEIEFYDPRVAQESAERDFDIIFNVQQSNYDTKFISNLLTMKQIKTNNDTIQRKDKRYKTNDLSLMQIKKAIINAKYGKNKRRGGITEISLKQLIDQKNEDDMKKLSVECLDLSLRRKKLETKRRNLILNVGKSGAKKYIVK